jgi:hypothetical protein
MVEMEGKDTLSKIDLFQPVKNMKKVNLIEEPFRDPDPVSDLNIDIGHHAIETYSIELE